MKIRGFRLIVRVKLRLLQRSRILTTNFFVQVATRFFIRETSRENDTHERRKKGKDIVVLDSQNGTTMNIDIFLPCNDASDGVTSSSEIGSHRIRHNIQQPIRGINFTKM